MACDFRLDAYDRLLLYGGTFDPPTLAHLELPEMIRAKLGLDVVLYMPAAISPFKTNTPPTSAEHRLAMLKIALSGRSNSLILTDEIERYEQNPDTPSYTIDTVKSITSQLSPHAKLRLLIGADQWHAFDLWKDHEELIKLAEPMVMIRPPDSKRDLIADLSQAERATWSRRMIEVPPMDISSSETRQRIAKGKPTDDLIPRDVRTYIDAHGLYR